MRNKVGGGCSAVAVSDSGGILRLVLFPPLNLEHFPHRALVII